MKSLMSDFFTFGNCSLIILVKSFLFVCKEPYIKVLISRRLDFKGTRSSLDKLFFSFNSAFGLILIGNVPSWPPLEFRITAEYSSKFVIIISTLAFYLTMANLLSLKRKILDFLILTSLALWSSSKSVSEKSSKSSSLMIKPSSYRL